MNPAWNAIPAKESWPRTIPPIFNTVYGSDGDSTGSEAGLQVRDFHHHGKGDMPGSGAGRYHGLDPDTYFWAHATLVEQIFYFADTFVTRLTPQDREHRSRPVNWIWDRLPMRVRYSGYAVKGYARS